MVTHFRWMLRRSPLRRLNRLPGGKEEVVEETTVTAVVLQASAMIGHSAIQAANREHILYFEAGHFVRLFFVTPGMHTAPDVP